MKTVVLANYKGGCAKTTTTFNLGVLLASQGARVLAIDLDPQGNLSVSLGADLEELEANKKTSLRMMLDSNAEVGPYLRRVRPNLDLLPCCLDHDAETLIEAKPVSRDLLLKSKLAQVAKAYDFCIIDTPPSLRGPTLNALAVSDLTIIPIETSLYALVGLRQLMQMIGEVRRAHSPKMIIVALSTLHVSRQRADQSIREQLEVMFKGNLLRTTVPRATGITSAALSLKAIHEVDPASVGAFAFFSLANEIRRRLGYAEVEPEAGTRTGMETEHAEGSHPETRHTT